MESFSIFAHAMESISFLVSQARESFSFLVSRGLEKELAHLEKERKDSKRCCDTTTPESIHTKDGSKRGSAFAFSFGAN